MTKKIESMEKQAKALALRKAGVSVTDIAAALGWKSPQAASKAILSALHRTVKEPADELRTLELSRLDDMLKAIASHVAAGNLTAIDRALKIQDRRAKLMGLDMPAKLDVTTDGKAIETKVDDARFDRAILSLSDALREVLSGADAKQNGEMDSPK